MIFATLLIFAANLGILAALIMAIIGKVPLTIFFILLGIKTLADLPLLIAAMKFFRCPILLWWLLPVQLLYPIYIVVAGILSQVRPVRWKQTRPTRPTD